MSTKHLPLYFDRSFLTGNGSIAAVFATMALLTLFPVYLAKGGLDKAHIGLVVGIFSLASLLTRPFFGWLSDRWGRKEVSLAGLALYSLSLWGYFVPLDPLWPMLVLRVIGGLGFSAFMTAIFAYFGDVVPSQYRASAFSFIGISFLIPMVIFPAPAEIILERFGGNAFLLSIALAGVLAWGLTWGIKRLPPAPNEHPTFGFAAFNRPLRDARFLALMGITVLLNVGHGTMLNFVALFMQSRDMRAGWFLTALAIAAVVVRVATIRVLDHWSRKWIIILSMPAIPIVLLFMPLVHGLELSLILGVIYGVGMGLIYPMLNVLVIDIAPTGQRGSYMGLYSAAFDLGFGVGSGFMGWIIERMGFEMGFLLGGIISGLALLLFLWGFVPRGQDILAGTFVADD